MRTFPHPLTPEEEQNALEAMKNGNTRARNLLIHHNLRLVAHVIKKYGFPEKDTEDYISIGIIGLIKAVDTYKVEKGSRLATYASRCIDNEILMAMRSGRRQAREVYLEDSIGFDKEGNEIHLLDVMESEENDVLGDLILSEDVGLLRSVMKTVLNPREYRILRLRYGFTESGRAYTQREVAAYFQISRSYVSRIEKKAVRKLRTAMEERNST